MLRFFQEDQVGGRSAAMLIEAVFRRLLCRRQDGMLTWRHAWRCSWACWTWAEEKQGASSAESSAPGAAEIEKARLALRPLLRDFRPARRDCQDDQHSSKAEVALEWECDPLAGDR